jgi:hypothetical protein
VELQLDESDGREIILALLDDEDFQNQNAAAVWRDRILSGQDIDFFVDDETFGLTSDNPVPVNGQFGQLTYLSRLRTKDGQGFFFQRLGSIHTVDEYQLLSFDGETSLNVFLDLYHPRRSRKPIEGLDLDETPSVFTGVPLQIENFPFGIFDDFAQQQVPRALANANRDQLAPLLVALAIKMGYKP